MLEAISMRKTNKHCIRQAWHWRVTHQRGDYGKDPVLIWDPYAKITKALIQAAFGHDADDQHNEGELENVEGKEYSSDDGDLKGDD